LFNRVPVAASLLERAAPALAHATEAAGRRLTQRPFVTVSTCSGSSRAGAELSRRTGGICENMEGAAAAQICAMHDLPFLELRGISNMVEDRDLSTWDLRRGAEAAQQAILHLLAEWHGGKVPA
jgi:futalosine hydrolase